MYRLTKDPDGRLVETVELIIKFVVGNVRWDSNTQIEPYASFEDIIVRGNFSSVVCSVNFDRDQDYSRDISILSFLTDTPLRMESVGQDQSL